MAIIISDHAKKRLSERVGVKPHKYIKLAAKALASTEQINHKTLYKDYQSKFHRKGFTQVKQLMGYSFIFTKNHGDDVLITVI